MQAGDIDDIGKASIQGNSESCNGVSPSNYLVCLVEDVLDSESDNVQIGIAAIETSTGDVLYSQFKWVTHSRAQP